MDRFKRIHFIGIGGIGMSALARLLLHEGNSVSGSDRVLSDITRALEQEGAHIYTEESAENITDDIELVVYSGAVKADHSERVEATSRGLTTMNYFEALALVINRYRVIAVAGTHGKTTTTAMLTDIFEAGKKDPTAIIGSLRTKTQSNFRAGESSCAIVEACEYQRHFLNLAPEILIITNIEHEHVDYFKDLADVQSAFAEFARKVPEDGAVIANLADPNVQSVVEGLSCSVIDYGACFDPRQVLQQPGVHNQMNAAAAVATARFAGIPEEVAREALEHFAGTWRRFEYKGEVRGAKVYDDYGHHPTEVRATIAGTRELYPDRKVTVILQPHTFSRTKELCDEFIQELKAADRVILAPIYAAREENASGISSKDIAERVPNAMYIESLDDIVAEVRDSVDAHDVVVVMGAGDITKVASALTK